MIWSETCQQKWKRYTKLGVGLWKDFWVLCLSTYMIINLYTWWLGVTHQLIYLYTWCMFVTLFVRLASHLSWRLPQVDTLKWAESCWIRELMSTRRQCHRLEIQPWPSLPIKAITVLWSSCCTGLPQWMWRTRRATLHCGLLVMVSEQMHPCVSTPSGLAGKGLRCVGQQLWIVSNYLFYIYNANCSFCIWLLFFKAHHEFENMVKRQLPKRCLFFVELPVCIFAMTVPERKQTWWLQCCG